MGDCLGGFIHCVKLEFYRLDFGFFWTQISEKHTNERVICYDEIFFLFNGEDKIQATVIVLKGFTILKRNMFITKIQCKVMKCRL